MKRTKTYLLLTVMLLMSLTLLADFTLKGKVIDEDNNALELVTVSCLEQGKVTMTNLQGEFSINLSSADSVEVRFSMIGYATRKRVFRRPKGKLTVQIVMHPMEALREVTITEKRPLFAVEGEKTMYNVAEDNSIQTGTLSDAFLDLTQNPSHICTCSR